MNRKREMNVTYLLNSGFLIRAGHLLLVFDDFRDPSDAVSAAAAKAGSDKIYFFASHWHYDHYDPSIGAFGREAARYILSDDIRVRADTSPLPPEKITYVKTYDHWQDGQIDVVTYSSTDEGTSFQVTTEAGTIFHAGDFNWWDWTGDTHENRQLAANGFHKQLKRMAGMQADLAFFPVDGRLGSSMEKGVREFVRTAEIRSLVTMHSVGYPAWQPSMDFSPPGRSIPVWSPRSPGEEKVFSFPAE